MLTAVHVGRLAAAATGIRTASLSLVTATVLGLAFLIAGVIPGCCLPDNFGVDIAGSVGIAAAEATARTWDAILGGKGEGATAVLGFGVLATGRALA